MWNEIRIKYKFNFIMCIIFFILGCLNLIMNYWMCRFFQLTNIIVAFVPFCLASILLIIFYKKDTKSKGRTICNSILIILSIILLIFNFGKLMISETFDVNNDVRNYPRTYRLFNGSDGFKHFPRDIPKGSQNVEFEEWAPFMQGGSGMYLSYDINDVDKAEIDKEFREKSKYIFSSMKEIEEAGENICIEHRMSKAIGKGDYYYGEGNEEVDDFIMYILEAKKISGDGYWNHGLEYGVIINKDTNRVVYFNEHW